MTFCRPSGRTIQTSRYAGYVITEELSPRHDLILSNTPSGKLLLFSPLRLLLLQFSFVLGLDTYSDLLKGKWAYSEQLLEQIKFAIVHSELSFKM